MEINGIAHIQLTINNFSLHSSFYEKLLTFLEMKLIFKTEDTLYFVGGRTGIAITSSSKDNANEKFDQRKVGLHHLCFRARNREDIDAIYEFPKTIDAKIIREPSEGSWAAGYYSTLFEDYDGIRIEFCFVPGRGNLDENTLEGFPKAVSLVSRVD